ncbi:MAG: SBBP repeat-containing protein [Acidobacteriota bacterium]
MRTSNIRSIQTAATILTFASLVLCLMPSRTVLTKTESTSQPTSASPAKKSTERMRISEAYGKLPLSFEENQGQADRRVKFLSRGPNYALLLTPTEAVLSLSSEKADSVSEKTRSVTRETQSALLRMKLMGANGSPKIQGRERLQGKSNYLIGNDRKKWHTDIPTYSRVHYDEVYPGIDLVYHGNQRRLEYDFVVAPGADSNVIRLSFDGADELKLDADGSLRLKMKGGEVTQPAPVIYQTSESGEKETVAGHYALTDDHEIGFEVGDYDSSKPLVIDPQLVYATFYGGSNLDSGSAIAVDGEGNAYITGSTSSPDLALRNAARAFGGIIDAFVVKLNPGGTDIVYATYLGSTNHIDVGRAIALTSDGKACVTGLADNFVNNSDFPTTSNRFQGNGFGLADRGFDAFLTVLTPAGNGLVYSTFFGGGFQDDSFGIAVDSANKIYITGVTQSTSFPTKNAFQNSKSGGLLDLNPDAFIAKFDPAQSGNSSLIYSSFHGGTGDEDGNAIAVTPSGVAFFVGSTGSVDLPTKSPSSLPPLQQGLGGSLDVFVAKVSPTGALIYSTYFGGNGEDTASAVAVDSAERTYITGRIESNAQTFPLKNAFQSTRIGNSDAFVAKLNADGTALFYSSFLSGSDNEEGQAIAVDAAGNAYVAGVASDGETEPSGSNFNVNGFGSLPGGRAFVTKIEASDATGTNVPKILYSDTFGGFGPLTQATGIALDPRGNVYLTGGAQSSFPATAGAYQTTLAGGGLDAFILKIGSINPDTIGVFHPPAIARPVDDFRLRNSNTAGPPDLVVDFGQAGDQPLAGDWNGDGIDDVGVFRPSTGQFLLRQTTRLPIGGIITLTLTLNFGLTGDKAVVGDWNGDGIDTVGVFRNGVFFLSNSPNIGGSTPAVDLTFGLGAGGDLPVAGDWNGDGIDTVGVFRPSSNFFFLANSFATVVDISFPLGAAGDLPFVGDWNGDGVDTPGLFRPSSGTMFLGNAFVTAIDLTFNFGQSGDLPIAGDWNGRPDPFTPPNSGVNDPNTGSIGVGQIESFVTTCSDPDGWHDIATIDFKIAKSDGNGNGVPIALWVQFNENTGLIRFYDPDSQTWQEGYPGTNVVLSSRFAELRLADAVVLGSGPTGPSVQILWPIVFKNPAIMNNYKQYLKITDDAGLTTGFDKVGSWSVIK